MSKFFYFVKELNNYRNFIRKFIFFLFFSQLMFFLYPVEEFVDIELIKSPSSPRFLKNGFLLTLSNDSGRVIFLKTNMDNWEKSYYFKKSLYDVFYLFLPYDYKTKEIQYKINIDGFWDKDPNNPNYIEDKYGTKISILKVPEEALYFRNMPIIEEVNKKIKSVKFEYYNPDAKEVNLVCSLDNWSPFSNPMKMNENGFWEIELDFSKGIYYYYFLVDWRKVIDIRNLNRVYDIDKGEVSFFVVE